MRYEEFRDVMLAKGYSVVDVMDCIRDFFLSDECPAWCLHNFWCHVRLFCDGIYDGKEASRSKYGYFDNAFNCLLNEYETLHNRSGRVRPDDLIDNFCYSLWFCYLWLDSKDLDDYWQDILKDC